MQLPPHRRVSLIDRLRYQFDDTMSRGPAGLIAWLALITLVLVVGATLLVFSAGADSDKGFFGLLWNLLYQTLTPNPVDTQAGSPVFLGAMLFVTIASLLLVSIFIGILTNVIDNRIQNLRKGRSFVIEHNHILILGWSSKIFTILSELVIANANQENPRIVILAEKDKVDMEDEIRANVGRTKNTRVICRTGSPIDPVALDIVNPQASRSIIILSPEHDDPDSEVIKAILALTNHPDRRPEPYNIVAEVREPRHTEIAKIVGRDEAELVLATDLISLITVQTCRQSGLSVVYTELLNFEGDEIYFQQEPNLVGKTYGEALLAYEDSAVMGLAQPGGKIMLNPPMLTRISPEDQIIAISRDDDTVKVSGLTDLGIDPDAFSDSHTQVLKPERTLILGWNPQACRIIAELDRYVTAGSAITVVADLSEAETLTTCTARELRHARLSFVAGDTTDRKILEGLDVASYDHVIILCYSAEMTTQKADAITLVTLLHLRQIAERGGHRFSIVSEIMDVRNRRLAEITRADDFIVSDMLTSLMLAQVSENRYLANVFADLFNAEGSEIYLKPASEYVKLGQPLNFYTIVESARRRGESAFGYRLVQHANDASKSYGVVVNPDKSKRVTFGPQDRIIVLAETQGLRD